MLGLAILMATIMLWSKNVGQQGREESEKNGIAKMLREQRCQERRSVKGAEVSREQRCQGNKDVESAEVSREQKC